MTAGPDVSAVLPASQVAELLQSMVKALRAFQMYLPNNPIYQRAIGNVRAAFGPIWAATDEISLQIAETDFVWEEQVVYHQPSKADSVAWSLYKDGMRVLMLRAGVQDTEIVSFLETVNRVRFLPPDAGDDLLTLLWERDFQHIRYSFIELLGDEPLPQPDGEPRPSAAAAAERRAQVEEEAPRKPGVVEIDDFDSTLYFLDESEIQYLMQELEAEYGRDSRASSLALLHDLFELETTPEVRAEILDILEQLFPNLLNAGEFRAVASLLRETRVLAERVAQLTPEQRARLDGFVTQLSEPAIVRQLLQSLDEAATLPGDVDVGEVLRELRPSALEALVVALPTVTSTSVRQLLEAEVGRLAAAHPDEIIRLLRSQEPGAALGAIGVCGRLQLQPAVPPLGEALGHADATIRLAALQALAQVGVPSAMTHIERAVDDTDRAVRLAAVRVVAARGYKGALRRVEAVVLGKAAAQLDLTEKMAFFEAYGSLAGRNGLDTLGRILDRRGWWRAGADSETRACAAVALGRVRTPEARAILERAADDRDLVVRNAISRALRGGAE